MLVSDCVLVIVAVPARGTAGGGRMGWGVRVGARPGCPLPAGGNGKSVAVVGATSVLVGVTPGGGGAVLVDAGAGTLLVGWAEGVAVLAAGAVLLGGAVGVTVVAGSAVSVAAGVG